MLRILLCAGSAKRDPRRTGNSPREREILLNSAGGIRFFDAVLQNMRNHVMHEHCSKRHEELFLTIEIINVLP